MFGSHGPEKSKRGRFWSRVKLAPGKEINGWLAGPVIGVDTHHLGRTTPCWTKITGGKLKCYCLKMQLERVWKGYVPLLDEDGVQCFAIICDSYEHLASVIRIGQPVTVSKLRSAGTPYRVAKSDWTTAPIPSGGPTFQPRDLRPHLLRLWKDQTLTEFFEKEGNQSSGTVTDLVTRGGAEVERLRDLQRAAAGNDLPPTIGESLPRVPSLNGKGKH